jgi:hypothetical protein
MHAALQVERFRCGAWNNWLVIPRPQWLKRPAAATHTSGTHSRLQPRGAGCVRLGELLSRWLLGVSLRTNAARVDWLAALKESDGINNELTRQVDWREDVDWESIGHAPPTLEEIDVAAYVKMARYVLPHAGLRSILKPAPNFICARNLPNILTS